MPDLHVIEELRAYLVAQGAAVDYNTPSLTIPSVLIDPVDGAPAPRKGRETATVTLRDTMLSGPTGRGAEAWLEEAFIDVVVRASSAPAAKLVHRQIRGLLHPIGDLQGRKGWTMGGLLVELSTIWRGEQPLDVAVEQLAGTGPRVERDGWARVASYRFEVRRTVLAGAP